MKSTWISTPAGNFDTSTIERAGRCGNAASYTDANSGITAASLTYTCLNVNARVDNRFRYGFDSPLL